MEHIQLDPFLENWKRVMATAPTIMKMVRVIGGVASITNGRLLLRCQTGADVADGFYKMVGTNNRLIPITEFDHGRVWSRSSNYGYWGNNMVMYPDIEQFNPRFETLSPFCEIDKPLMKTMMAICEHIRRLDGNLLLGDNYLTMRQKPHEDLTLTFNFSIPNGDEYMIDPEELKLALVEMMRYDRVFLTRKESDVSQPLILGLNWGQCALISTDKILREEKGLI